MLIGSVQLYLKFIQPVLAVYALEKALKIWLNGYLKGNFYSNKLASWLLETVRVFKMLFRSPILLISVKFAAIVALVS